MWRPRRTSWAARRTQIPSIEDALSVAQQTVSEVGNRVAEAERSLAGRVPPVTIRQACDVFEKSAEQLAMAANGIATAIDQFHSPDPSTAPPPIVDSAQRLATTMRGTTERLLANARSLRTQAGDR
jgi:hypothetical protein